MNDQSRNVKALIDDQQHLLDKAKAELAEFDSQPAMVEYEAQRKQIYDGRDSELRRLDTQHNELLKQRNDLLALRTRAEICLEELRKMYHDEISEQ